MSLCRLVWVSLSHPGKGQGAVPGSDGDRVATSARFKAESPVSWGPPSSRRTRTVGPPVQSSQCLPGSSVNAEIREFVAGWSALPRMQPSGMVVLLRAGSCLHAGWLEPRCSSGQNGCACDWHLAGVERKGARSMGAVPGTLAEAQGPLPCSLSSGSAPLTFNFYA